MFKRRTTAASLLSSILVYSIVASGLAVFPQDLVASDELSGGGSSVFVFRESRKKPQAKAAAGVGFVARSGGGRAQKRRLDGAYLAANRKRTGRRGPATGPRGPSPAAKIKLSTTLTAKADTLLDGGQTDQAIATYREALKNNPKNMDATLGLSDALTAKGIDAAGETNNQAGIVFLDEAVKLDPRNDIAFAKLGEIYAAGDQTERSIENYEKAVAINPNLSAAYVPLGMAYLKTGNIAKADVYAAKAEAGGQPTAEAAYLRGLVYHKQNKNSEALAAFQRTLSLDANYSSARYYEAVSYERLNQADRSLAVYKQTVETDPQFAPAWFDLGVAYYNAGDYNNALIAYQQAIKHDPENARAHLNLASTYRQLERYSEANVEYAIAAKTIKDDPDLYSEWGFCLGKTNEWDKSALRLIAARELSPTAIDDSNVSWAYLNAGHAAKEKKDENAAKSNYEVSKAFSQKAVEKDPKLDAAYMNLGVAHNGLGEFQLAVNVLNTAVGLRNNWVIAINQLGVGYKGLGNLQLAIAQFQRATTLDANNVFGLFSLGEVYHLSGNKKEAKKIQDRLKRINPVMAGRLDTVFSGKAAAEEVKRKVESKVPRIPRIPY